MCTSGDDCYESGQPFLFGAAEREESLRELEQDPPLCGSCNGSGEGYADGSKCLRCYREAALNRDRQRMEWGDDD